ncbi:hypothetical protein HMPREF9081_0485 [Centipeda periodontii DSM 2778]|uniref:Uncharacterized protein n=1 Tax=Centipeda periodontii DSM 2778 TaxID=888060 RepID=F5RJQ0_9FIRM|nr:hypothetical protein HMPREF9081_0485 [Centipeda periodontii DSM 2778]
MNAQRRMRCLRTKDINSLFQKRINHLFLSIRKALGSNLKYLTFSI